LAEAIRRLCDDGKATAAAKDKQRRTEGDESKAAPANSLRLVRQSNLPRPVELLVLSFLPFMELHKLSELSTDMGRLVQSLFASLRSFSLFDPDWILGERPDLRCVWSALSLLQHCRQLQHLSLNKAFNVKHDQPQAACSVIARNALTLETCDVDTTLVHMALLAQCQRLTKFDECAIPGWSQLTLKSSAQTACAPCRHFALCSALCRGVQRSSPSPHKKLPPNHFVGSAGGRADPANLVRDSALR
jgi:hypothetical protein